MRRLVANNEKLVDTVRQSDLQRQEVQRQADLAKTQADLQRQEAQRQADLQQRQADLQLQEVQRQADLQRQEMLLLVAEEKRKAEMAQQALSLVYNSEWKAYASILARYPQGLETGAAPRPASRASTEGHVADD